MLHDYIKGLSRLKLREIQLSASASDSLRQLAILELSRRAILSGKGY
ncbi:protein of unknown function (plasmid) [Magnetospirillum sp. XM-1]|nr:MULTISPECIES: hypothetical protein [unclassified Magnetospirillum]CUW41984.1 protein of unknown function [Magnetospirillum sp. XM-1]